MTGVLTDRERAHFEAVRGQVLLALEGGSNAQISDRFAAIVAPLLARIEALEGDGTRAKLLGWAEQAESTKLREQLALRDSEIAVLKTERDDVRAKLDAARLRLDAAREDRDIVRTDLGKELERERDARYAAREELAERDRMLGERAMRIEELEGSVATWRYAMEVCEVSRNAAVKSREAAERTIAHLRQQLAEVTARAESLAAKWTDLEDAAGLMTELRAAAITGALAATHPLIVRADEWLSGDNVDRLVRGLDVLRELVNALPLDDGPRIAAIDRARRFLAGGG